MITRCYHAQAALLLACSLISSGASAAGQAWAVVESGEHRVIADDSPATAEALFDELVVARSMLKQIAAIEPQVPLQLFGLKDRKSLMELAPNRLTRGNIHTFGFSHTGPHAAFIALRTDRPAALRSETLRHEYAHVLTAAASPDAPAWLDEGLSEFWGSIDIDGDRLVAGRAIARHLQLLRKRKWLPLDAVLNQRRGSLPSSPEQIELFYAQSWAMVHYLLLGNDATGLPRFMPSTTALPAEFDAILRQYVAAGRFREALVPWQPPAATRGRAVTLPEARALAERANLLVSGEQAHTALAVARQALAIDPNEPLALEVTGTYHFLNNQPDQARAWLARAITTGADSYRAAIYLSLLATSPADREQYLASAVRSKPDSAVAWQRLMALFEDDGRLEVARGWCRLLSEPPISRLSLGQSTPFCPGGRR